MESSFEKTLALALVCVSMGTILGILIISRMKRGYLEEVYMLTFFDETVLSNNLRITSYVLRLQDKKSR